jgi:hypothetical protein
VPSSTAFATSETSARNHRLHHLGRSDGELVLFPRNANHALLQRRDGCVADFHGEVAARHHDALAGRHDVGKRLGLDRFRALYFRDEESVPARRAQKLPRHVHVGARFGEGHGKVVHFDFRRRANVLHVLGRQGGSREAAAQAVDALVVREHPSVAHAAVHLITQYPFDLEHDLAVVEEQHVAGPYIARQFLVVETDASVFAQFAIGVEHEGIARAQHDFAVLEPADPDLRALQIAHDADRASGLSARLAHHLRAPLVIRSRAMREVHSHDVDSCEKHALERLGIIGRRSERGDDLGTSAHQPSEKTRLLNFGIRGPLSAIFPVCASG